MCRFACFDFQHYAGAPSSGDASHMGEEVVHGKMEKSYLNFCENHPKWTSTTTGNQGSDMVNKINTYRQQKESEEVEKSIASLMNQHHQHHHPIGASSILPSVSESKILSHSMNVVNPAAAAAGAMKPIFDHKDTTTSMNHNPAIEDSFSFSQQLLQSQAIQAALGQTQHENNFYWLEKVRSSTPLLYCLLGTYLSNVVLSRTSARSWYFFRIVIVFDLASKSQHEQQSSGR